jgi:hypothetical protein
MDAKAMAAFYDNQVRELADQQKGARAQIEKAFLETPPASPDDVDAWFEKSFHKAPVSHDTRCSTSCRHEGAIRDAFTPRRGGSPAE